MWLLLQSCLKSTERLLGHAAIEQHGAVELPGRSERAWRNRVLVRLVFRIGGGRHSAQRLLMTTFGIEQPGARDLALDIDNARPVRIFRFAQLVRELGKLGDLRLGCVGVAGTCRTQGAGEMGDGLDMSKLALGHLETGGARPIASFNGIARRSGGESERAAEALRIEFRLLRLFYDRFCLTV